jgi:hypothetical protein
MRRFAAWPKERPCKAAAGKIAFPATGYEIKSCRLVSTGPFGNSPSFLPTMNGNVWRCPARESELHIALIASGAMRGYDPKSISKSPGYGRAFHFSDTIPVSL